MKPARLRRRRRQQPTTRILEGIAAERLVEPSPTVLIPLSQAAVDEGRPELQAMWAALMANAMVDGGKWVRRDYFAVLRQLEPPDVLVIDMVRRQPEHAVIDNARRAFLDSEIERLGLPDAELWISIQKLRRLECLGPTWLGDLTHFARGLMTACSSV